MKGLSGMVAIVSFLGGLLYSGMRAYDQVSQNSDDIVEVQRMQSHQSRLLTTICLKVHEDPGPCLGGPERRTK